VDIDQRRKVQDQREADIGIFIIFDYRRLRSTGGKGDGMRMSCERYYYRGDVVCVMVLQTDEIELQAGEDRNK
jgi:hypothetical protein